MICWCVLEINWIENICHILCHNIAEKWHVWFEMCRQRPQVRDGTEVGHSVGWLGTQLYWHATWGMKHKQQYRHTTWWKKHEQLYRHTTWGMKHKQQYRHTTWWKKHEQLYRSALWRLKYNLRTCTPGMSSCPLKERESKIRWIDTYQHAHTRVAWHLWEWWAGRRGERNEQQYWWHRWW